MFKTISMMIGYVFMFLGLAMLIPGCMDFDKQHILYNNFFMTGLSSIGFGIILFFIGKKTIKQIGIHQAYALTLCIWIMLIVVASAPFIISGNFDSVTDAVFEATSGITSTGATVLQDVQSQPKSILLWRAMLNAFGGIGIVVFAVTLMPFLGVGGMQIFQRESSDFHDRFLPRISDIAQHIILLYAGLMVVCGVLYYLAGMDWFDAICHALTTVSTGGFSTKNNSLAFFNSIKIETIAMIFMLAGALPFTFYFTFANQTQANFLRKNQVKTFLKTILVYVLIMTAWLVFKKEYSLDDALRFASFNVISVATTTGYCSADYLLWGSFAIAMFLLFYLTGGCTGSTSGSIKIFRWQVLWAFIKKSFAKILDPYRVTETKIGKVVVDENSLSSVMLFFATFVLTVFVIILVLTFCGVEFAQAMSMSISCLTNTGPSIDVSTGPMGSYALLTNQAKHILITAMILGRMEIITVLVLFTKDFWHK